MKQSQQLVRDWRSSFGKKLSFIILFSGVKVNYDGQLIEFIAFDAFYGSKIHLYHTIPPFLHTFSSRISSFRLLKRQQKNAFHLHFNKHLPILVPVCFLWSFFVLFLEFLKLCVHLHKLRAHTPHFSLFFFIRRFLLVEKRTLIQTFYFLVFSLSGDVPRNRRNE